MLKRNLLKTIMMMMKVSMMINDLAFIGSNRKKFNFNIFEMPRKFLLKIYNGQITLKREEFLQRKQRS